MQHTVPALPDRAGCATLDHPDIEDVDTQSCANPEAETSKPEEPLAAEYRPLSLVSGAGHDALAMAKLTKVSSQTQSSHYCLACKQTASSPLQFTGKLLT